MIDQTSAMTTGGSEEERNTGSHSLAARRGEQLLFFREIRDALGHGLDDLWLWRQALAGHLVRHALLHVVLLEREERHQDVDKALLDDSGLPKSVCRKSKRERGGSATGAIPEVCIVMMSKGSGLPRF